MAEERVATVSAEILFSCPAEGQGKLAGDFCPMQRFLERGGAGCRAAQGGRGDTVPFLLSRELVAWGKSGYLAAQVLF
ncbi:BBS4 isoform 10 [Pan troglodytes]|uniref:BBS4 isoform 10 n=1 Tax=Pan troglodytes TaxID=9598 RepID=A0A2J8KRF5_PANTR|nr:BBS4 isoform 10 [Pan troglodytes]